MDGRGMEVLGTSQLCKADCSVTVWAPECGGDIIHFSRLPNMSISLSWYNQTSEGEHRVCVFKMVAGVKKCAQSYLRHPKPKGLHRSNCQCVEGDMGVWDLNISLHT